MKYKSFTIKPWKNWCVDIGTRENSPVKIVMYNDGFCSNCHGFKSCMGETVEEVKKAIDGLIAKVMENCNVTQKEAILLIKES